MKKANCVGLMIAVALGLFPYGGAKAQEYRGQDRGGGDTQLYFDAHERLERRSAEEESQRQKQEIDLVRSKYEKFLSRKIADTSFKSDLLTVVNDPQFRASLPEPAAAIFSRLFMQGLTADIQQSPYLLQAGCADANGRNKTLSTAIGTPEHPLVGSAICVDMKMFVSQYSGDFPNLQKAAGTNGPIYRLAPYPFWILFGLFIHDHARHFGIRDENHEFAAQLSQAVFAYNNSDQNVWGDARRVNTTVSNGEMEWIDVLVAEYDRHDFALGAEIQVDRGSDCYSHGTMPGSATVFFSSSPTNSTKDTERAFNCGSAKPYSYEYSSLRGSLVRVFSQQSNKTLLVSKLRSDLGIVGVRVRKVSKLPFLHGLGGQGATLRGDNFNSPFADFDEPGN